MVTAWDNGQGMPQLRSVMLAQMPPRRRADAERDPRRWLTECIRCGHRSTFWDWGGLGWRAVGGPLTGMRCIGKSDECAM